MAEFIASSVSSSFEMPRAPLSPFIMSATPQIPPRHCILGPEHDLSSWIWYRTPSGVPVMYSNHYIARSATNRYIGLPSWRILKRYNGPRRLHHLSEPY